MALRAVARRALPALRAPAVARAPAAAFTSDGVFDDRQRGEINAWARKHDAELIARLAAKLHSKENRARDELMQILGNNKLPEDVIDQIVDWKTHH